MSLYAEFMKERENVEVIENEKGFITYSKNGELFCVHNLYVTPDYRNTQVGYRLFLEVEDIAREMGIKKIYTTVSPPTNGSSENLKRLLNNKWHLQSCVPGLIYLYKDIGGSDGSIT